MGCCLSKAKTQTQNQNPNHYNSLKNYQSHLRSSQLNSNPTHEAAPPPSPPPPHLEEESVKEVLSETPISKPHQVPILTPETKTQMPLAQNPDEDFETKDPNPITIVKAEEEVSELVSQLSETCSMNESFSTATTATITEKREEDEATSKRSNREQTTTTTTHKWNRSPSYASSRKRPYSVNGNTVDGGRERRLRSPARKPEPSPEKKIQGGSRSVRGRESGPAANRKLNAGFRRDSGEGSGRRSRSPSCTRMVGGTVRVGADGGRKQVPPADAAVEKEEKSESVDVEEKNDVVQQEESLENPHVSMECFIFL